MKWKAIGNSVCGTSHVGSGRPCEDAVASAIVSTEADKEVLIVCVSDGAGSAEYAREASSLVATNTVDILSGWVTEGKEVNETAVLYLAEMLYDELAARAIKVNAPINEFSCTFLGCILYDGSSIFFQIGDGAIIREDGNQGYVTVWWPQNGEYSNTTSFLIDDYNFGHLKIAILEESVDEIAITTDGLQLLILNNETASVHHPFFDNLFRWLRLADKKEDLDILDKKLTEYLSGNAINARTDDDKTLFLATRLK